MLGECGLSAAFHRRRGGGYFGSPMSDAWPLAPKPTQWPRASPASPLPVDVKAFLISGLHGFPGAAGTDCPEAEAYRLEVAHPRQRIRGHRQCRKRRHFSPGHGQLCSLSIEALRRVSKRRIKTPYQTFVACITL